MTYSSLKSRSGAEHVTGASLPLTDDGVLGEPEYSLSPPSGQLDGRSSALSQDPLAVAPGSHVRSNILHRAPPCPYVTVTGSDGRRVYLRIKDGGRKGGVSEYVSLKVVFFSVDGIFLKVHMPCYLNETVPMCYY